MEQKEKGVNLYAKILACALIFALGSHVLPACAASGDHVVICDKTIALSAKEVSLSKKTVTDGDALALTRLPNLTELFFDQCDLSGLSAPFALPGVQVLTVFAEEVDLAPFSGLTGLKKLTARSHVSDLRPLANCTQLEWLDLKWNDIVDVSPLAELVQLIHLDLFSNQIADIAPLSGMTKLIHLHLDRNQISDLEPLKKMKSLIELSLADNRIANPRPLAALESLTWLALDNNPVSPEAVTNLQRTLTRLKKLSY